MKASMICGGAVDVLGYLLPNRMDGNKIAGRGPSEGIAGGKTRHMLFGG